uniref:Conserved oligomeric Golgi complex subunit 2 (Trinotate prediction) n=1 Tax=Henneguya salminicola TaxID=69463 RepID=A0A6G3ME43_HENSL
MKCIFALKIIEYNEFLTNFASTYVEQEYELLEKILDDNNQVIICAEILIELHSFPKYDQIPQILRDTCFKLNGETVLKIEEKLDHIFIRHLQKLINYITNLYGFLIDTEIYQEVENTLNRFNHIFRAKTMENCFLTIFDKIIDTNNGIDEIFDQTLQLILSPMSIYHRIITSTVKFNWKFDILTNSLIFSLYSHLNKYYYVLNDPDSFHVSFCKVNLFLQTIENLFYRPDQIKSFRKHEHIINLLKKWNISTYFQTRRRFIITKIEMALKEFESRLTGFTSDPPKLFETATEMLKYCFDANVILPQLVGRFWGLFLQVTHFSYHSNNNLINLTSLFLCFILREKPPFLLRQKLEKILSIILSS